MSDLNVFLTNYVTSFLQDEQQKKLENNLLCFYGESFNTILEKYFKSYYHINEKELKILQYIDNKYNILNSTSKNFLNYHDEKNTIDVIEQFLKQNIQKTYSSMYKIAERSNTYDKLFYS